MHRSRFVLAFLVFAAVPVAAQDVYQTPPPALAALVDAPPTPRVSLSPDRAQMLLMGRPSLPSIAELAEPELGLAGSRINPRTNGPSRSSSYNSLALQPVEAGAAERAVAGLPAAPRIRNVEWAPDGRHVAFTNDEADRIDLWLLDVSAGQAERLTTLAVNDAAGGTPFAWAPDSRSLLVHTVPADRGAAPEAPLAPTGPVVQENMGQEAPARTYQDLLTGPHDEALFEHYFDTEVVRVGLDRTVTPLGIRGLVSDAAPSPDGRYVLVERWHRPFSYLVPSGRFPNRITVHAADGALVEEIADLGLAEEVPVGYGSVPTGIRSLGWRADADATLYWTEALDGGDIRAEAAERDRVFLLDAPFDGEPVPLVTLPLRYGGVMWGDGFALVLDWFWNTRMQEVYLVDPDAPGAAPRRLLAYSWEDRYNDPGSPVMQSNGAGQYLVATADDGQSIFLSGEGASPDGNRPFLRKIDLASGETEELFRSEAPYYEDVVAAVDLDERTILTRRETAVEPPNYYLRDLDDDEAVQLTSFPHPYPELAEVQKETIQYERADGVPLSATLYLPAGYDAERDGPLPGFVWAYPQEFKSADAAGQRTDSPFQFKYVSYWGAVPWVTRGYAVFDDAAMPIVGEGDDEPNDAFVEQLVANAQAVIDEGVRRGVLDPDRVAVAGHSYGAFMTANLLAHSDLFRAGIARSGAYNRTLTPFGFQSEERTYWEAPEVYYTMSPFMHADAVDEPILLIHGAADNNSGTFPMQSERYFNALKGLGKTARLVMLPHESHGYRARASVLHMVWEMDRWLDTYVKNAAPSEAASSPEQPADTGE
ncbi:MAG: prolyl oligopeptidase family serine peptidase [Rhodothermales bacterium]